MEGDLSHLCDHLIQGDGLIVKVPSVDQVRIVSCLDRAVEIFFLKSALAEPFLSFFRSACTARLSFSSPRAAAVPGGWSGGSLLFPV